MQIELKSDEETRKLGALLASCIETRAFIGLVGNLGAGKTTLTQGLAAELGVEEAVNSPTFLMLNEYHSGRLPLYHFDLYRMQEDLDADSSAVSALKAELDEILSGNNPAVVIVEWLNLWEEFGADFDELRVQLSYEEGTSGRRAALEARGAQAEILLKRLQAAWAPI